MPVHTGKDSKGCFAQWGGHGKKYYYTCGNSTARDAAKAKAGKQGAAAHAAGYVSSKENEMLNKKLFHTVVANFTGLVRHDKMEGREYLVAPMIMLTEGVHSGSDGPLLYPEDELSKTPQVWNHKPVIVYHPNGASACDPDVLSNRKIGIIMNTVYKDGKLKAEAWLEMDRMAIVDGRVAEAVENKKMLELSTGLFADLEKTEGEWNGEAYTAIAKNYRPDHLAILPDLKGACSIDDGAGFLRLNEMGYGNVRSLLSSALRVKDESAWIEGVYDKFFIYEKGGKLYKQNYSKEDNEISLTDIATEVVRVTEYRTTGGEFVGNVKSEHYFSVKNSVKIRKDSKMKKKKTLVNELITNEQTQWDEEDRESLMELDRELLEKMQLVKNEEEDPVQKAAEKGAEGVAAPAETPPSAPEKPAEKPAEETPTENKAKTVDEYIKNAPVEMQGVLRNGLDSYNQNKTRLIKAITANEKNVFTAEQLAAKDLDELRAIAKLAIDVEQQKEETKVLNFGGQGPILENDGEDEEPLDTPTMNFNEKVA